MGASNSGWNLPGLRGDGGHINSRCGHKIYDDCERERGIFEGRSLNRHQSGRKETAATFASLWPLSFEPADKMAGNLQ